jgi:hypothetical protein
VGLCAQVPLPAAPQFDYAPTAGGGHSLRATAAAGGKAWAPGNTVERVVVLGAGRAPKAVAAVDAAPGAAPRELAFSYDAAADAITVRKPDVKIAYDFEITFKF